MEKPPKPPLPDISQEQIASLVKFLEYDYYRPIEANICFGDICCGSDGVSMGINATIRYLEYSYGLAEPLGTINK